jgi:Zn-dependent peptidase ImmA (M78 family)
MQKESSIASAKAEEIISLLKIRHPSEICIQDIAMERGAYVKEAKLEGCEARLTRRGKTGIIRVKAGIHEEGRRRFAIAHELGHLELHDDSQLVFCSEEDMLIWNENKVHELEANTFAATILMPKEIFTGLITDDRPNMDEVSRLATEFRTTLMATAIRYVRLSKEPCAVAICKDGVISWYKGSDSFNYHIKVHEKLSPNTHAFDFFDGVDLPKKPMKAPAYPWIAGNIDGEAELMEHPIALPRYNTVLSLLWIFEEIRFFRERDEDEPEFDLTNKFTPDGRRWQW